ncbi:MAG: Ig-like domain-containing protein, partial [Lachnospiraceae bacterium]|nr:Ig-like domain-containing protein [Lachnospiraceae bacterium]
FDTPITRNTTLTAVWVARLSVNIEGLGQISIAEAGKTPEFDDEFPTQSAIEASYIGLYDSFVVGAKADAGYQFVEWKNADTNKTYSKDPQINVTVTDNMSLVAVFEYDDSIATKVSVAAAGYTGTTYTLVKGKTLTLTPTVSPAKASQKVTYKSNNTKVAKVNEKGKVTAVKAGTAKITVSATDGSGKKQTVTVKVVGKAVANKALTLKKKTAVLRKKGASAQITIGSITKGTTDKITYKVTSGSKLISVDKLGVVKAKKAPTAKKQTAKVTVKCGTKSVTYTVTLKK